MAAVGFLNVCHLSNKTDELIDLLNAECLDILCVAETFLTPAIPDSSVKIPGYEFHRKDRLQHGGGVGIYVRSTLSAKRRRDLESDHLELIFIELGSRRKRSYLGCLYRPPSSPVDYWEELGNHFEAITSSCRSLSTSLVLVGDLNINVKSPQSPQLQHLEHFMASYCLRNYVTSPTHVSAQRTQTIIDLLLAKSDTLVHSCRVLPITISDHFAIISELEISAPKLKPVVKQGRNLKRLNMEQLREQLRQTNLSECSTAAGVDEAWERWINKVQTTLDVCTPLKKYRPKISQNVCPWKTSEYHDAVVARDRAHRQWRQLPGDSSLRMQFSASRALVKRLARQLKRDYYSRVFDRCSDDSRTTWSVLKSLAGESRGEQHVAVTADDLSKQFGGVVTDQNRPQSLTVPAGPPTASSFHTFRPVTEDEVRNLLHNIEERKATGSDGIPCGVLKHCADVLSPSLTNLMNLSFSTGVVPGCLKQAHVRPLFKGGDPEIPKNYRPVSLLPVISKTMERFVHTQLTKYLAANDHFPRNQFAYRSNHSTEDAVLYAIDRYLEHRDTHQHTGLALLDMSKAFDKVSHQLLITDLYGLGITSTPLAWMCSYLSGRKQKIVMRNGEVSNFVDCQCGVPQGSVLGPLLFLLYTRQAAEVNTQVHCQMFADDIMLDCSSCDVQEINYHLSEAVSQFADYLGQRSLLLNEGKTQIIGIHRTRGQHLDLEVFCNGKQLKQTNVARYLGLCIDDKLSWTAHINSIVRSVSFKIHTLWQIRRYIPETLALRLYKALIVPSICYASNAFYSSLSVMQKKRLALLCKRAIRCVASVPPLTHTVPIYSRLNVQPVLHLMSRKLKVLMFRINNYFISPLIYNRVKHAGNLGTAVTRASASGNFALPGIDSCSGETRPLFQAILLWNALPARLKQTASRSVFEALLE